MTISKTERNSRIKFIINAISYALLGLIFAFLVFKLIRINVYNDNTIFGRRFYNVLTDSMEPTLNVGDVVVDKTMDSYEGLPVGTIITFDFSSTTKVPNTHRIVGYVYRTKDSVHTENYIIDSRVTDYDSFFEFKNDPNRTKFEIVGYKTQGDNSSTCPTADINPVYFESIQGVYHRTSKVITFIKNLFSNFVGFLVIIVIPLILVFISQIVSLAKAQQTKQLDNEIAQKEEEINDITERLKQEAIDEYLRSQNKENNDNKTDAE